MVCSVEIILYCVEVIIFFYLGLEVELVMVVVKVSLQKYIVSQMCFGWDICCSVIFVVLYVEGVQCVELVFFLVDVVLNKIQVVLCMQWSVINGGMDEQFVVIGFNIIGVLIGVNLQWDF